MRTVKLIVVVLAFCFFIGSLIDAANEHFGPASNRPRIAFDSLVKDLGKVSEGQKVSCEVTVRNSGRKPLILTSVKPGCAACIEVIDYSRDPIPPHGRGRIQVKLNTSNLVGPVVKQFRIVSNDPTDKNVIFSLKAVVEDRPVDTKTAAHTTSAVAQ